MPNLREVIAGLILMGIALVAARGITTFAFASETPNARPTAKTLAEHPGPNVLAPDHVRIILPAPWQSAVQQADTQR